VHKHFFLIREPFAVLSSWKCDSAIHGNNLCIEEIGYTHLMSAFSQVEGNMDADRKFKPIVIDSDDLVSDPKSTLEHLCASLGIPFRESMLSWEAGPHKCDGPFASYWYYNVHKTDGWVTKSKTKESSGLECIAGKRYRMLDPRLNMALKACVPIYEFFQQFTESYKNRGPPAGQKIYEDPRNEHLVVWVGSPSRGRISPRLMAGLNPFDSAVEGGDAVWEGMRVHDGKIPSFEEHLDRLLRSAKALAFENVHTKDQIMEAIFKTLAANCMRDDTYIRVTLTRGEKSKSSLDPKSNIYGTTLIILPEWKPIDAASDNGSKTEGIALISASERRHPSSSVLSNIQSNNMVRAIRRGEKSLMISILHIIARTSLTIPLHVFYHIIPAFRSPALLCSTDFATMLHSITNRSQRSCQRCKQTRRVPQMPSFSMRMDTSRKPAPPTSSWWTAKVCC